MFLFSSALGPINEFMCTVGQFVGHGFCISRLLSLPAPQREYSLPQKGDVPVQFRPGPHL